MVEVYTVFVVFIFLSLFYAFCLNFCNRISENTVSFLDFFNNIIDSILLKIFGAIGIKKEKEILTISEEQEKNNDESFILRIQYRFNKIPQEELRDFWQERESLRDLLFTHLPYWCKRKRDIKKTLTKLVERKVELDILRVNKNNLGDKAINSNNCKISDLEKELIDIKNKIGDCNIALVHFEGEIDMIQLLQNSNLDSDLTMPTLNDMAEKYFIDRKIGRDGLQRELGFDIFAGLEEEQEEVEENEECEI